MFSCCFYILQEVVPEPTEPRVTEPDVLIVASEEQIHEPDVLIVPPPSLQNDPESTNQL